MLLRLACSVVCVASLAAPSHADILRGELGFVVGAHIFGSGNGLGVPDGAPSQETGMIMGLRLGGYLAGWVGVEAEVGAVPSGVQEAEPHSTMNLYYRLNAVLQFRATDPSNHLLPFVLGGLGGMSLIAAPGATMVSKESVNEYHFGAGVKWRTESGFGLRSDLTMLLPASGYDFEITFALYKEWGGGKPTEEAPQQPTPAPVVVTPTVTPPAPAENSDRDGDGILDAADMCPADPEDKDNFADTDGCPDLDNDSDGVVDANDKCPTESETRNGFTDDDGCPDEVPAKVKQFTGKVEGISFKTGSADLVATSNKALDSVVAVLNEYPQLKVEVGGHTDDAPLTASKKFKDNDELSQARAEAVKAYLVKKGISTDRITAKGYGSSVPVEDPTGLKGAALTAARTKNRRVEFKVN
jgi:OmpA-OmpF porin, OOP family